MAQGIPEPIGGHILKFQLSIRSAFYLTTAVAVYSAIVALAYRGNIWGQGITFAVTCSFLVWVGSVVLYWAFILLLKAFGIEERNLGTLNAPIATARPIPSPSVSDLTGPEPSPESASGESENEEVEQ